MAWAMAASTALRSEGQLAKLVAAPYRFRPCRREYALATAANGVRLSWSDHAACGMSPLR
jgi:hypothetical protein